MARGREYAASDAPERAVALFEQALGLWHGRPFTELEEWEPGRLEAARLSELRLAVVEDLLQARLDAGDHRGVAAAATVAAGEEPFRERRWAILALAQYRGGRQADALALDPDRTPDAGQRARARSGLRPGRARTVDPVPGPVAGRRARPPRTQRGVPLEGPVVVRRQGPGRVLRALGRDRRRPGATGAAPVAGADGPVGQRQVLPDAGRARTGPDPARPDGGRVHAGCRPRRWRWRRPGSVSPATRSCSSTSSRRRSRWPGRRTTRSPGWPSSRRTPRTRCSGGRHAARGPDGSPHRVAGLRPDGRAGRAAGRPAPGARRCGRRSRSRRAARGCAWSTAWST